MVTFAKNPYSWADDQDINSAVLKFDMTYNEKPFPATSGDSGGVKKGADSVNKTGGGGNKGIGVTLPLNVAIDPSSFTKMTLTEMNDNMAVISVKRVSNASLVQVYIYVGTITPEDIRNFNNLDKISSKSSSMIYSGYVNVTLFHGNSSDVFDALNQGKFHLFQPVWLYNFRLVISTMLALSNSTRFLFTCHKNKIDLI